MSAYERYAKALGDEPLPCAFVDLDAVDRNVETLVAPLRRRKKTLRVATKSLRSVELVRYVQSRAPDVMKGLLCYSAREADYLAREGFDDLLVAYPTARAADLEGVAARVAKGAHVSLAADDPRHLELAAEVARRHGVRLSIVIDVDVSYRPLGEGLAIGVKRSPLHAPRAVADFAERILRDPHLALGGLLAYEAHVAGVPDRTGSLPVDLAKRAMKARAIASAKAQRRAILDELERRGIAIDLFDGGGSGSVEESSEDDALTEIAAGSGFVDSHLFDGYRRVPLSPAAYFALAVTRLPAPGFVTCQSGGFIASGAPGADRWPMVALPEGLALTRLEGAGEVQTPLSVPSSVRLSIGDPVFFRHAKAGELAEHFDAYLLVRGDRVEARAPTYRGAGRCFH